MNEGDLRSVLGLKACALNEGDLRSVLGLKACALNAEDLGFLCGLAYTRDLEGAGIAQSVVCCCPAR